FAKNFVKNMKQQQTGRRFVKQTGHKPSADFTPSDTSKLEVGMKVEHPKFGFGEVLEIDRQGSNQKAKVNFEKAGEKTLLLSFAKLKIH
ncbi:MAG: ATP-dependent DNA helicase, partial [Bacteroidota bacterium]